MAPTWSAIRIAAGFRANVSPWSVTTNTPGSSAGPMQVSSPRSMVKGHGPSVQVAALTVLDFLVPGSSMVWPTASGDEQPASSRHNPSPTASARTLRAALPWSGLRTSVTVRPHLAPRASRLSAAAPIQPRAGGGQQQRL